MAHDLHLPLSVVSPADVIRLRRNLEQFNDQHQQATLRAKSGNSAEAVSAGQVLREFATMNKCDLEKTAERQALLGDLEALLKHAPTVTMSFASEPSAAFMTKIVNWFRTSIHPALLISVGLQPTIAAGCILRAGGKVYDLSLRHKFTEQRTLLIDSIRKASAPAKPVVQPEAAPAQGAAA